MVNLKIRVYKEGDSKPETSVTIPVAVLKIASKMIPKKALSSLGEQGIDINEIVKLAGNKEVKGTILEVEEHKKKERIVITLE